MNIKTFTINVTGQSGKEYALSFEGETFSDVEAMLDDIGLMIDFKMPGEETTIDIEDYLPETGETLH